MSVGCLTNSSAVLCMTQPQPRRPLGLVSGRGACDVDRQLLLAASQGKQPDGQTRAQASKARASAEQIRSLAARAHAEIRMPTADELGARVDNEAVALTTGLASLSDTRTARSAP